MQFGALAVLETRGQSTRPVAAAVVPHRKLPPRTLMVAPDRDAKSVDVSSIRTQPGRSIKRLVVEELSPEDGVNGRIRETALRDPWRRSSTMRSPFPGMDPYLEQYWGDVHHSTDHLLVRRASEATCPATCWLEWVSESSSSPRKDRAGTSSPMCESSSAVGARSRASE